MKIEEQTIKKLIKTIDAGLVKGLGIPEPGKMCVEAAICYALGLPHSDDPKCVVGINFKITLNDANWPNDKARAEGMKALAIAQIGSSEVTTDKEFYDLLWIKRHQRILPKLIEIKNPEAKEWINTFSNIKTKEEFEEKWSKFKESDYYNYYNYNDYYYYYYYYVNDYYVNDFLKLEATIGLECFKELKSPGCDFLYLLD